MPTRPPESANLSLFFESECGSQVEGGAKAPKSVTKNKVAVQLKGRCDNCS